MRGKRTVHHRMISARKRAMLKGFSAQSNSAIREGDSEAFLSPFASLLGDKRYTSSSGSFSFRDRCQTHLSALANEIKISLSEGSLSRKNGGVRFRLLPKLLETNEYNQFLGESYAQEVVASSGASPFIRALGLIFFDLGVPSVSAIKTITPLPGGWLDLLVRGAQELMPEWRVSIAARKVPAVGKVEVLLCLVPVETNLRTLTQSGTNVRELLH